MKFLADGELEGDGMTASTITPDLRKQMDEMEQLRQSLGRMHTAHLANLIEIIMPPAPVRRRRWWEQLFLPKPTQKEDD